MRKVREVLRLYYAAGMSLRAIARSLKVSPAVPAKAGMGKCIRRAEAQGLGWPLPDSLDDAGLERRLFPAPRGKPRPVPRWSEVHRGLRGKGVTLALLWEEYKAVPPEGLQYSWFCEQYRAWASKLDVVMRQEHRAGGKLFVDSAGHTVGVVDRRTGELRQAQVFVAVLEASSYIPAYAGTTWTQGLADWVGSHACVRVLRGRHAACIEDIDFRQPRGLDKALVLSLADGRWVREHLNVLITGPAGIGKSWMACALAHSASYRRLPRLLSELAIARADGSYPRRLASLAKTEVLVIDDFGLAKLTAGNRRDLLEIIEDRYGIRSTVVTSQLPVEKWHDAIGDPTLADAILDRLVHSACQLNLKGESMRKRHRPLTQTGHRDS